MILGNQGFTFYEAPLAYLESLGQTQDQPRYFSSSEQLIGYLKKRPNQKFSLVPFAEGIQGKLGAKVKSITPPESITDTYGPDFGDVFCGDEVYYDSRRERVVTITNSRIWS
jgi:hypothetical protein